MRYAAKWYDNKAWLKMMYIDKNMTMTEIGMYAGVSRETIRKLLIKYELLREK